ncbi:MAG: sodium:solute symporter family protein [Lachnospiraceae bacterium]|nr:sodium:solute symporter family protein [Lachnospiraceae bacterium]
MKIGAILIVFIATGIVLGGCALLSWYLNKRNAGKEESWAIQKTPLLVTIGTTFATAFGGGMLTYHTGLGYQYGWSVLWYGVCQGGGIFMLILIAKWLRRNEFKTIPEILTKVYGESNILVAVASLIAMVTPFGWIAGQCVAFGKMFATFTGIPQPVLTIIFAVVVLAFVWPNGYGTVAWSDAIFGFCIAAVCIVCVTTSLGMAGGWTNVAAAAPELAAFPGSLTAAGASLVAYWFMSVFPGQVTNQMYIQRVSASDTIGNVYKALGIACFMVFAGDIFAGFMGRTIFALNPNLEPESAFGWFLTQIPVVLMLCVVGLVGASIMSTCDSAVQTATVSVVYDIYQKLINPNATQEKLTSLSRIVSAVLLTISVAIGLKFPSVMGVITTAYSYGVAMLLFPIFGGYYLRNKQFTTRFGCYCSMFFGALGNILAQKYYHGGIPFVMFGLIASIAGLLIGSALTRNSFYAKKEA